MGAKIFWEEQFVEQNLGNRYFLKGKKLGSKMYLGGKILEGKILGNTNICGKIPRNKT